MDVVHGTEVRRRGSAKSSSHALSIIISSHEPFSLFGRTSVNWRGAEAICLVRSELVAELVRVWSCGYLPDVDPELF